MPSWILPALSSIVQLGLFFAAAIVLVMGVLRMR
jgi:hypothetical protein